MALSDNDIHTKASDRVMSALQESFSDGTIPGGGMVTSFVCIVESFDNQGRSKVQVFWSDPRTTVLLGLMAYGNALVHAGMGESPPDNTD